MKLTRALLVCGPFAVAWYIVSNLVAQANYPGYEWTSQVVSELSAVDAPSRPIWVQMGLVYSALMFAFGIGIWRASKDGALLKVYAATILLQCILDPFWPPMHRREVIAAEGGTLTDTLHIAFTAIWGMLVILAMILAAISVRGRFAWFTVASIAVLIGGSAWTAALSPQLEANLPTPILGVVERLGMAGYYVWLLVFTATLLQRSQTSTVGTPVATSQTLTPR